MAADRPTDPYVRIVVFTACILVASVGGYVLRRLGWVKAEWARRIMSAAIVCVDAPIAWLAVWHLDILAGVWKVPVVGGAVAVAVSLAGLGLARRLRLPPGDAALFGLQGGMGNVGYSLGGFLCFALWGLQGLALEQMFCMMWPFYAFLFCFPLARHYGLAARGAPELEAKVPPWRYALRVLGRSLLDLRSLPLYMVVLGLTLNLRGVAPPAAVTRWHVIDVLMVAGILMQFGGVGMTVRVSRLPRFWRLSLGTAGLKLLVHPLLMLATALAFGMSGMPLYVCVLLGAMPSALYSVLMANIFGLNRDLANATFILTHAVCLTTVVPLVLLWPV